MNTAELKAALRQAMERVDGDLVCAYLFGSRARIRFEVRARNECFDLAPVRARYRTAAGEPNA